MKAHEVVDKDGKHQGWAIFCPACGNGHMFDGRWTFNGNRESPTFTPSMHIELIGSKGLISRCHSFVTDGKIQYLGDCTHAMKGQTVDVPDMDNI